MLGYDCDEDDFFFINILWRRNQRMTLFFVYKNIDTSNELKIIKIVQLIVFNFVNINIKNYDKILGKVFSSNIKTQ